MLQVPVPSLVHAEDSHLHRTAVQNFLWSICHSPMIPLWSPKSLWHLYKGYHHLRSVWTICLLLREWMLSGRQAHWSVLLVLLVPDQLGTEVLFLECELSSPQPPWSPILSEATTLLDGCMYAFPVHGQEEAQPWIVNLVLEQCLWELGRGTLKSLNREENNPKLEGRISQSRWARKPKFYRKSNIRKSTNNLKNQKDILSKMEIPKQSQKLS